VRILLAHPDDAAILVHGRDGTFTLPRVRLCERVSLGDPPALIAAVRVQLGLEITELFPLAEVVDEQAATVEAAVVCEIRAVPVDMALATWIGADRLEMVVAPDRMLLGDAVARISCAHSVQGRAPWFERGWFAAGRWLCAPAQGAGYELVGPVEQFRAWCISSVLRVPTTRGMIYLKASCDLPLFVNEAVVTQCLGSLFPEFVPAPLAIDAGRGWLALRTRRFPTYRFRAASTRPTRTWTRGPCCGCVGSSPLRLTWRDAEREASGVVRRRRVRSRPSHIRHVRDLHRPSGCLRHRRDPDDRRADTGHARPRRQAEPVGSPVAAAIPAIGGR